MKNINIKDNALIKRKNLKILLKRNGIKRINKNALNVLENHLEGFIIKIVPQLKERLIINLKKTLEEKDISAVLQDLKKDKNYWEV